MRRIYINAGQYGMFLFRYILLEFQKIDCEQPNIYMDKGDDQDRDEYVIYEDIEQSGIDILSNILVQYIFNIYEPEIIGSLIGNLSGFYDYNDRYTIFDKTKEKIADYKDKIFDSKKAAYSKIAELLNAQNVFNIEGFIVFRLKEYIFFLRKLVEESMDDFLSEKEHAEFLRMLAYFVDMQDSRIDRVHLVTYKEYGYLLFDDDGKRFQFQENNTIAERIAFHRETEDILIGMLMSLLPEHIVIHDKEDLINDQMLDVLFEIFKDRVEVCNKCPECHIFQTINVNERI